MPSNDVSLMPLLFFFKDPEAVKQYREVFGREGIAVCVKKYGWAGLRQFVTDRELTAKVRGECSFSAFCAVKLLENCPL